MYSDKAVKPEKDGTAEVTYTSGNCTPRYFDDVPVTARIVVTEDPGSYQASYKASDFLVSSSDTAARKGASLATQELQMQEGKDGFVLFSNRKTAAGIRFTAVQKKALALIALIIVFLAAGVMMR